MLGKEVNKKRNQHIIKFIGNCLKKEHSESYLIAILHKKQGKYGLLCDEQMTEMAQRRHVPI